MYSKLRIRLKLSIESSHHRVEELIEIQIALPIMFNGAFSQISLPAILQILVAALLKSECYTSRHFDFCIVKSSLKTKNWTHHERKPA